MKQQSLHLLLCLESCIASIQIKCTYKDRRKKKSGNHIYFFSATTSHYAPGMHCMLDLFSAAPRPAEVPAVGCLTSCLHVWLPIYKTTKETSLRDKKERKKRKKKTWGKAVAVKNCVCVFSINSHFRVWDFPKIGGKLPWVVSSFWLWMGAPRLCVSPRTYPLI